jgi:hypothetical protein
MAATLAMIKCAAMQIMQIEHVQLAMPAGGEKLA